MTDKVRFGLMSQNSASDVVLCGEPFRKGLAANISMKSIVQTGKQEISRWWSDKQNELVSEIAEEVGEMRKLEYRSLPPEAPLDIGEDGVPGIEQQ